MKWTRSVLALGSVVLLAVVAASLVPAGNAQLVSNALGSHMVLHRAPQSARLWGWTKGPGQVVRIVFGARNFVATSGHDGKWMHELPPTPAGGPHTIVVTTADGSEKVVLEDVYFGDVWLCGGQSNMQMTVNQAFNATEEIALANKYPHIRLFTVGKGTTSTTPLQSLRTIEQPWSVANSTSINGRPWAHFSAVCWFFGKELYDKYQVPIGLVSSNWGGTIVQAWSSPDALNKCKAQAGTADGTVLHLPFDLRGSTADKPEPKTLISNNPNEPSVLWNAMIVPFLDMSFKGAIWYQGESNAGQAHYYSCAFPAMIEDWRAKFAPSGAPLVFLFVQLAPWIGGAGPAIPDTRAAQESALKLADVGMATAIDLGDPTSPEGNIHPRDKQEVGRRLSLAARWIAYGDRNVNYLNPRASRATLVQHTASRVRVQFDSRTLAGGLVSAGETCPLEPKYADNCAGFQILFNNGQWVNATASIMDSTTIEVFAPVPDGSLHSVGVRYAWASWPVCTLYSKDGLPALQFQFTSLE